MTITPYALISFAGLCIIGSIFNRIVSWLNRKPKGDDTFRNTGATTRFTAGYESMATTASPPATKRSARTTTPTRHPGVAETRTSVFDSYSPPSSMGEIFSGSSDSGAGSCDSSYSGSDYSGSCGSDYGGGGGDFGGGGASGDW